MFHEITIIGNAGRDPEMRYLPDGTAVTNFSVAVNTKSGKTQETTWYKCTAWGKRAEMVNMYLTKGRQVFIKGQPKLEQWTSREGKPYAQIAINISEFRLLGSRDDGFVSAPDGDNAPLETEEDDIPF
ncbi:MAG: single-stranded DNA-binding protein [Anaerolineales bacterium]|nr:single-stranded DNA-binding protein [Anaerolineales bacterium]